MPIGLISSSMMFWILSAVIIALVAYPLMRALASDRGQRDSTSDNLAFFAAQEAEIDRQQAAGLMAAAEADAAKAEAARRLIAMSRVSEAAPATGRSRASLAMALVALMIPVVALPMYLTLGAPNLPAKPYDTRTDLNRGAVDLARLVGRLDAHLAESPDDARGWELAFPVYMRLGRFDNAVEAATRIIALRGETAERQASLAEALISAAQGEIAPAAREAIEKALALDPKLSRARFFSGMVSEQSGDARKALEIWRALLGDLADGPEKALVSAQIDRLTAAPANPAASALQALPAGEQAAAIRGMVDGLAARLKQGGGTAEEWQRLVRALYVLGDKDRALAALADAREALKNDPAALVGLDRLASEAPGAR